MSAKLVTTEIRNFPDLQQLLPEWWDLWHRSAAATPFTTPAWLLAWWRVFHPGDLLTITVRHDGRLIGLAPLYVEAGQGARRILPLGVSISDYLDCLIDPSQAQSVADAIVSHVALADIAWDSWEFADVPPDADALRISSRNGWVESAGLCQACPVLSLPAEPVHWDREMPAAKRRRLRMARSRAQRRGDIGWSQSCSVASALDSLIRLHGLHWRTRGEAGVLADPRVRTFHHMAAPALMEAGLARFYVLTIGGTMAAVYYGFLHRRRAYAYLTGFDPAFAFESPGTILIGHAIEQAAREGAREFDMLRGQETYKYDWGAKDRWTRRRVFQRNGDLAGKFSRPALPSTPHVSAPLHACARGELAPNVALMQAAVEARTSTEVEAALLDLCGTLAGREEEPARARLEQALALWRRLPDAFATVKRVLQAVDHAAVGGTRNQAVARCASAFDRAASLSPAASVALYSLGDAGILDSATDEVVRRIEEWGLLDSNHALLDLGCGNGRVLAILATRVRLALGIDVSPRMLAAARRSCAEVGNAAFARTSGCDLAAIADRSIDLICAIDSFPYLVQCDGGLAAHHICEATRVLRPSGNLLIINYSYRGSLEADRRDVGRFADAAGLRVERDGTRDFALWDGVTFLLRKQAA